jgi:hypothetical protein
MSILIFLFSLRPLDGFYVFLFFKMRHTEKHRIFCKLFHKDVMRMPGGKESPSLICDLATYRGKYQNLESMTVIQLELSDCLMPYPHGGLFY